MISLKELILEMDTFPIKRGWCGPNGEVIWSKQGEYHKDSAKEYLTKIGKWVEGIGPYVQMGRLGWARIAVLEWAGKTEFLYESPEYISKTPMTRKQKSELKNLAIEFHADIVRDSCVT